MIVVSLLLQKHTLYNLDAPHNQSQNITKHLDGPQVFSGNFVYHLVELTDILPIDCLLNAFR